MTPEHIRPFLDDLRQDILRHLANISIAVSIPAAWFVIKNSPLSYPTLFLLGGVIGLSWLIKEVSRQHFLYARYLAFAGSNIIFALALIVFDSPYLPFFSTLLIFANALFIWRGEALTAAVMFLLCFCLDQWAGHTYPLKILTVHILFSVVISWLIIYTLHTAIQWYHTMHREARHLLEEVRDQRAVLTRTLNSLEVAYTTQKQIHQDLQHARQKAEEALRMKERFAANISHELRTPINIILGFSEVMYLSPETYPDVNWTPLLTRDVHQIYRSSHYLMEMIDDILDLSYFEQAAFTINLEPTELSDFFEETAALARNLFRNTAVAFEVNIPANLPAVQIDRTRIRQVILNLLNNARRFTEQGVVQLNALQVKNTIQVSIQDSGAGIPPDKLPLIFGEYFQVDYSLSRKHGGAGLGLAISKKFINAHKGDLWVESQVGAGSTFTFSLPITDNRFKVITDSIPVPPRMIAVNMGDAFLKRSLERYLENFDIIFLETPDALEMVVQQSQPKFILHNTKTPLLNCIPLPYVYGDFSNFSASADALHIQGRLSKPISASRLYELLDSASVKRLMVIDDAPEFCQLIERYIQMAKLETQVFKAYDGQEGLLLMKKYIPDLVLLDFQMPGISGIEIVQEMREHPTLKDVPVYLVATANFELEETGMQQAFTVVLPDHAYPPEIFQCVNAVEQVLKQRYIR